MAKYLRIYRDFSGGLSEAAYDNIEDNQLLEARNIVPGEGYGLTRACGTQIAYPRIDGSEGQLKKIEWMVEAKMANDATRLMAYYSEPDNYGTLYCFNADTDSWNKLSTTDIAAKDWFFYAGQLYWLNGETIRCYNGGSIFSMALEPLEDQATAEEEALWQKVKTASVVEQRGLRWFYATADNEVIFSEIGYPNKFKPTNIINIGDKSGGGITAMHEFNEGLLIFTQHSVYYLAGWDFAGGSDIRLYNLNTHAGTRFPRSVCTADNGVFYLSNDGVYRISLSGQNAAVRVTNISEGKISRRLFESGTILDAHAVIWENAYYLAVEKEMPVTSESGSVYYITENYEYRYYFQEQSFFGEFTQPSSCYAIGLEGKNALFLGCNNGYVLRYDPQSQHYIDPLTGEETAIDAIAKTKCYDIAGSLAQEVRLQRLEVAARQFQDQNSNFKLQICADYDALAWSSELEWAVATDDSLVYGEGLLGTGIWGWQDTVTKELLVRRRCKRLQFIITADGEGEPLMIYGLAVLYRKKRIKGSRRGVSQLSGGDGTGGVADE